MYANIIRCQELYDDMCYAHQLNPDLLDRFSFDDKVDLFVSWAKEFLDTEKKRASEPDWDWIGESEMFFTNKLIETFTEPKEYVVNFFADVDVTIKAHTKEELIQKANKLCQEYRDKVFDYVYLAEIKSVTDINGNEVR